MLDRIPQPKRLSDLPIFWSWAALLVSLMALAFGLRTVLDGHAVGWVLLLVLPWTAAAGAWQVWLREDRRELGFGVLFVVVVNVAPSVASWVFGVRGDDAQDFGFAIILGGAIVVRGTMEIWKAVRPDRDRLADDGEERRAP